MKDKKDKQDKQAKGEKLYRVIEDRQGGTWAMGLDDTALEWVERAMGWADMDGERGIFEELDDMRRKLKQGKIEEQEVINFIDDFWDITFMESEQAEREGYKLTDRDYVPHLKFFKVEKGVLCGDLYVGEVDSSGEVVSELELEETTADTDQFLRVVETDEEGNKISNDKYYYIGKDGTEEDIINRIKATHDPFEWQNHQW